MNGDYRLCHVDGKCAWFTTQDVSLQWGDDWNDSPYEHNAGDPYAWREDSSKTEYHLWHVYFETRLSSPADNNISLSVEQINAGAQPWLQPNAWDVIRKSGIELPLVRIYAGTSYPEFVQLIEQAGGTVFAPSGGVE